MAALNIRLEEDEPLRRMMRRQVSGAVPPEPPWRIMMMAHDSSPPPASRLSDETVAAVRSALREYLANGASSTALQRALVQMSAEAREKGVLAEQLLVILKDLWSNLPEVRAMADSTEQVQLRQRVVTMCIKEYYSA